MRSKNKQPCAVVVGAGARSGLGGAISARIARELPVYVVGRTPSKLNKLEEELRNESLTVTGITADVTNMEEIKRLFATIEENGHVPELVVFNASTVNMPKNFLDMTPQYIEDMWRVCYLGGVMVAQETIRRMLPQNNGTLIFTGATASTRGGAKFGAFAAAKAALRSHSQSMAREFGPKGIHVSHVVIDGVVDGQRVKSAAKGIGRALVISRGEDGTLHPDAVAESYWQLHVQHRSAWTHELDLRPFKEKF